MHEFCNTLNDLMPRFHMIPESGCWLWDGPSDRYGVVSFSGKTQNVHRAMWQLAKGKIPEGMSVLHKCDTGLCGNPDHLFLGTQSDNVQDCVAKGRHKEARKTHCPQGHEYDVFLVVGGSNKRRCSTCINTNRRNRRNSISKLN